MGSDSELLCIASKEFQHQITVNLKELYEEKKFTDVTLVTDDQVILQAHKFILRSNSNVFKTILDNSQVDSKTIFLRGVKHEIFQEILKFCYLGSVEVKQEKIMEFFETASDLQIKEFEKMKQDLGFATKYVNVNEEINVNKEKLVSPAKLEETKIKAEKMDSAIQEKLLTVDVGKSSNEFLDMNAPANKAILENFESLQCDQCDIMCKNEQNLRRHKLNKHDGVRYSCDECDYKATQKTDIKRHKEYKHEGIKYGCNECEYQATTTGSLKLHVDARHRGITYPCNSCDHKATTLSSLGVHMETKHQGKSFPCDFCDFTSTSKYILKNHKKKYHTYYTNQLTFE